MDPVALVGLGYYQIIYQFWQKHNCGVLNYGKSKTQMIEKCNKNLTTLCPSYAIRGTKKSFMRLPRHEKYVEKYQFVLELS